MLIFMWKILESEARFRALQEPILQAIMFMLAARQRDIVPITNQEYELTYSITIIMTVLHYKIAITSFKRWVPIMITKNLRFILEAVVVRISRL